MKTSLYFIAILHLIECIIIADTLVADSTTFKKCSCAAGEIETSAGCIQSNYTNILIWNSTTSSGELLDLTSLPDDNVVIQPLECPDSYTKIGYFQISYFTSAGKLIIQPDPDTDLYCIENTIDPTSGGPTHRIEVCISSAATFLLCCERDQFMDPHGDCLPVNSSDMSTTDLLWPGGFSYQVNPSKCEGQLFPSFSMAPISDNVLEFKRMTAHFNLHVGDFCLGITNVSNTLYYLIKSCNSSCVNAACVPLCCEPTDVYDINSHLCVPYMNETQDQSISDLVDGVTGSNFSILPSKLTCLDRGILHLSSYSRAELLQNSSLLVNYRTGTSSFLAVDEYCLGNLLWTNGSIITSGLACLKDQEEVPCQWKWVVIRVGLIVSSLFIIATLIVYLGVPELRRRIQGACLIAELIALLVSQVNLVVIQLYQASFSPTGCLAAGVIELIFILASFFWLNVMCYDVWSTLRKLRPFNEKFMEKKLFAKYSLYAWGIPLLIGVIVVVVEQMEVPIRPSFNNTLGQGCFFNQSDLAAHWVYMYSIISLLLVINCGFFVHLAYKLLPMQMEQRKMFKSGGGSSITKQASSDADNVKLYAKLFIIMGLPWLCEIFSSFTTDEHRCYIWILDLINLLRGVFIFVIFVCKKTTRDKIVASWCPKPPAVQEGSSTDRSRKTSTMSLSSWLPTSRKISKPSMTPGLQLQMSKDVLEELPENESTEMMDRTHTSKTGAENYGALKTKHQ